MKIGEGAKRLLLVALGILLALMTLEGALHARAAIGGPQGRINNRVPDARVGFRPNPAFPGNSSRGWRNAAVVSQADIVAFGDSQTYGWHVPREGAWPQQLGSLLGRSVYQMASPGYAPPQYVPLLNEALALRPKVVLAAYYFGNDIYDSYWFIYKIGDLQRSAPDPVLDAFATTDPQLRMAIARAEQADPKYARAVYLDCGQPPLPIADPVRLLYGPVPVPLGGPGLNAGANRSAGQRLNRLLRQSLVLRGAWRGVRVLLPQAEEEPTDYGPPLCVRYRDGTMRTIFNVGLRLFAVDDTDPRTAEGQRVVFQSMRFAAARCRQAGIRFYVVMIPSKETAFRTRAEPTLRGEKYLVRLWHTEARARESAQRFFAREGIAVIDTLPALEALIASGINPYLNNANGHPIARGYEAMARAIAKRVMDDGVPPP